MRLASVLGVRVFLCVACCRNTLLIMVRKSPGVLWGVSALVCGSVDSKLVFQLEFSEYNQVDICLR